MTVTMGLEQTLECSCAKIISGGSIRTVWRLSVYSRHCWDCTLLHFASCSMMFNEVPASLEVAGLSVLQSLVFASARHSVLAVVLILLAVAEGVLVQAQLRRKWVSAVAYTNAGSYQA